MEAKKPVVLKEGYFTRKPSGESVDFYNDFYWPFVKRWEEMVNKATAAMSPDGTSKIVMVEGVPNEVRRLCSRYRALLNCKDSSARNGRRMSDPRTLSSPLIGILRSDVLACIHTDLVGFARYDLNTMFSKQFGFLSVNVQALSRMGGIERVNRYRL